MLFPDVVNCMQTDDLELKKLVYLYLINYAKTQPDLAIMGVNTFVKVSNDLCWARKHLLIMASLQPLIDYTTRLSCQSAILSCAALVRVLRALVFLAQDSQDPNPLIRALAVRTMGCIRVAKITEYLCDPLQRCLKASTARKAFN